MVRRLCVVVVLLGCSDNPSEQDLLARLEKDRAETRAQVLLGFGFRPTEVSDSAVTLRLNQLCRDGRRQVFAATFRDSAGRLQPSYAMLDTGLKYHSGLTLDQLLAARATCVHGGS